MEVVLLSQQDVRRLLSMKDCIELMETTLSALARGEDLLPLRSITSLPGQKGALAMMPAYLGGVGAAGAKVLTVFPGNEGTEWDSHQGVVVLFEAGHGRLVAIADATEITAIRTAATSGAATRALARKGAGDLALLGSGTQARTHLEAMLLVANLKRIRVWSRKKQHAEDFSRSQRALQGIDIEVSPTVEEAVTGADLICTVTSSRDPIIQAGWISDGAHINAVGYSGPEGRELSSECVLMARLFVDRRESALAESGDLRIAMNEGVIGPEHIRAEIGEVFAGKSSGRGSDDEVTLFESVGLAVEDLASAHYLWKRAEETGVGTRVELGGMR